MVVIRADSVTGTPTVGGALPSSVTVAVADCPPVTEDRRDGDGQHRRGSDGHDRIRRFAIRGDADRRRRDRCNAGRVDAKYCRRLPLRTPSVRLVTADCAPSLGFTSGAIARDKVEMVTVVPPDGAAVARLTVPLTGLPPTMDKGVSCNTGAIGARRGAVAGIAPNKSAAIARPTKS